MKHFYRTIAGKIINYVLCIMCLAIMAGGIAGTVLMLDAGVYDSRREWVKESLQENQIRRQKEWIVYYFYADEDRRMGFEHTELQRENTNLRFWIEDTEGNTVGHNLSSKEESNIQELDYVYSVTFCMVEDEIYGDWIEYHVEEPIGEEEVYTIYAYVDTAFLVQDTHAWIDKGVDWAYALKYWMPILAGIAGVMSLVCFVLLMCGSGRRPKDDEVYPGVLSKVPTDVLLFAEICIFSAIVALVGYASTYNFTWCVAIVLGLHMLLGTAMSIANRLKRGVLFKNTVIAMLCGILWKCIKKIGHGIKVFLKMLIEVVRNLNVLWRWALAIGAILFVEFMVILLNMYEGDSILIFWMVEKLLLMPVVFYGILSLYKLKKGGEALAGGDLNYKTDTTHMLWDLKRHGENLNSIGDGMAIAVGQRLQSERMKTELITNVSHDIKTPLTSIINYAGLIGDEPCDSEKHKEYAGVLVRKSEQLKRLLEDLVEISKVNSGNLDVQLETCEAGVLLTQVSGEFEQRCQEKNLELIVNQPEEQLFIQADSRRIWRVFENLMNNVCKYSLSGSRVYLSLEKRGNEAVFVFRNTSAAALNISPKELQERFVRGEQSRTTEGNGLGLSIAGSLVELQGGTMDIVIDGDLFKVIIGFQINM